MKEFILAFITVLLLVYGYDFVQYSQTYYIGLLSIAIGVDIILMNIIGLFKSISDTLQKI